ncbi:hypothetical protein FO519_002603 [Halicephalobus sp. NKZ332]|nr:hypothetical protein FO519_002603 [Halicephalobus sp. NKZ332]
MDSEFEFNAPKFHDFDAESSDNTDNQYFNKLTTELMSPGLNLTDKENITSAMGNLSIKQKSAVDFSKCQKGALPGGIGDFSKLSFFNRGASKAAQKSRRRSHQIVIEPESKTRAPIPEPGFGSSHTIPTPKPLDRRNSGIPVPTKTNEDRRRSNVLPPPSQMVLRSRTTSSSSQPSATFSMKTSTSSQSSGTSFLSQRQANQFRSTRTSSAGSQPSTTSILSQRQANQSRSIVTPSTKISNPLPQKPVTRRSFIQPPPAQTTTAPTRRRSVLEAPKQEPPQPPTRRRSVLEAPKQEPPQPPPRPRRPSLFSNLPPLSQVLKSNSNESSEAPKQESILSRRYFTRSARRQS